MSILIAQRNAIDAQIAAVINRPAQVWHIGEWVAAQVFDIELNANAAQKGWDGRFASGPLAGSTVNIKWYGKHEGLLDAVSGEPPDFYLVLTGPKTPAGSSRGQTRPWAIEQVFVFESAALLARLDDRKVRVGIATSVASPLWSEAEIYPEPKSPILGLTQEQQRLLSLFSARGSEARGLLRGIDTSVERDADRL